MTFSSFQFKPFLMINILYLFAVIALGVWVHIILFFVLLGWLLFLNLISLLTYTNITLHEEKIVFQSPLGTETVKNILELKTIQRNERGFYRFVFQDDSHLSLYGKKDFEPFLHTWPDYLNRLDPRRKKITLILGDPAFDEL